MNIEIFNYNGVIYGCNNELLLQYQMGQTSISFEVVNGLFDDYPVLSKTLQALNKFAGVYRPTEIVTQPGPGDVMRIWRPDTCKREFEIIPPSEDKFYTSYTGSGKFYCVFDINTRKGVFSKKRLKGLPDVPVNDLITPLI